jgi:hypothetical protein
MYIVIGDTLFPNQTCLIGREDSKNDLKIQRTKRMKAHVGDLTRPGPKGESLPAPRFPGQRVGSPSIMPS